MSSRLNYCLGCVQVLTRTQSKRRRTATAKGKVAMDSDSDDIPLVKETSKRKPSIVLKKPPKASETAIGQSEDSDTPLDTGLVQEKAKIQKRAEQDARDIAKAERKAPAPAKKKQKKEESESDAEPIANKRKSNGVAALPSKKKTNGVKKEESEDDDVPLARKSSTKKANGKVKTEPSVGAKPGAKGKAAKKGETEQDMEAEEEEEEYRWWEDPTKGDGTDKWAKLEHNGVVFPPPYEPLPKSVKMRYDGTPVTLSPEVEEVAGFFGAMLNSTHNVENPTFQKNFFEDFRTLLDKTGGAKDRDGNKIKIKEFAKCDFKPIFEYYEAKRMEKKALPAAEKKAIKAEKDAAEAPFLYCMWDGRKQKVGNFRVEPPGLFRGRGEHPKTGRVKGRVQPEQITINIGKDATPPAPPEGHRWKEIKHDRQGTWLAMWQENINGAYKYVMLAANSDVKGQSDFKKFEKARELKVRIFRLLCFE